MVVLKKVKAATLIETLVATVLIVLLFMISSFVLNSVFNNTVKYNTNAVKTHLAELMYLTKHSQVKIPYSDEYKNWYITIEQEGMEIRFEAVHKVTSKIISMERYEY